MKVYFSKASKYVELDRVRRILQEFHDHVKYLVLFLGSSTLRLGEVCPRTVGSTNSECIPKWQEKEMTCLWGRTDVGLKVKTNPTQAQYFVPIAVSLLANASFITSIFEVRENKF